ncbi:MAG: acyloxyacyl hydrolase [Thermodesulfobacteriota bacterium]
MHRWSLAAALFVALALVPLASPAGAAGERSGLQEMGVASGYGFSERGNVQVIPLFLRFGWFFPDVIDEPLARHGVNLEWMVEPWIAGVTNHQDAVEVGVHPIVLKLAYDRGQWVVPYLTAGTGVMYTGLQGLELGGPFEFSSYGGGGIQFFFTDQLGLNLSYRWRHISNAGIEEPNRGLDTQFVLIGLDYLPGR